MRVMFGLVQLLDGFETTDDNLRGLLPGLLEASGFSAPELIRNMATPLGTIAIIRAVFVTGEQSGGSRVSTDANYH